MVDECICRRCEKEIKNNINKENYDPTWRREQQSYRKPLSCIVAGCTTTSSMIHSQKYNASKVAELLQVEVSRASELTTTLCEEHYKRTQRLAKNYNVHKKCYMCHCRIPTGRERHCPNPNSVKAFYDEHGNVDVGITEEDIICTKCYNHHQEILQNEDMKSRDSELAELLQSTSPVIEAGVHAHIISAGLQDTVKQLGNVLTQHMGLLLPELYREFLSCTVKHSNNEVTEPEVAKQLPQAAFLCYISSYFGKHLAWKCFIRSYGRQKCR